MHTPCNKCVFLDDNKCEAEQYCKEVGDEVIAPGFCRIFTADTKDNSGTTVKKARGKSRFRYDLVVLFDGSVNTEKEMMRTYHNVWRQHPFTRIIAVDTSGGSVGIKSEVAAGMMKNFGPSSYLAKSISAEYMIEIPVAKQNTVEMSIAYGFKNVASPYFLVIGCGETVTGWKHFRDYIDKNDTREIYWNIARRIGKTRVHRHNVGFGVYISSAYKHTKANLSGVFFDKIEKMSQEVGVSLGVDVSCWVKIVDGES